MFWSYLIWPRWNNALSYDERKSLGSNLKIFIPDLINFWQINSNTELVEVLDKYLILWDEIVFEEVEENKLVSKKGLKNYLFFELNGTKYAIFDNHNVALYFIWEYFLETWEKLDLIHIDQHSDLWKPDFIPERISSEEDLVNYTFTWTNVWNYLIPAQKLWFINQIYQVRTEYKLMQLAPDFVNWKILNIDLDFWSDDMATTRESLLRLKKLIPYAKLVLFATSPYFIDQNKAISLIKELLI